MIDVQICTIEPEDIEEVTRIYGKSLHAHYTGYAEVKEGISDIPGVPRKDAVTIFRGYLEDRTNHETCECFVARVDNLIIGFGVVLLEVTEKGDKECWVDDFAVIEEYRHKGIGKLLMNKILDWGKTRQAKFFFLEVGEGNTDAMALYKSTGYKPLSTVYYLPTG